jgi:hypothetical protein
MGAVWLGRDEVLGRQVALKRIGLLGHGDSTDLARAEREARLAARLSHPHVVSVFNLAIDPDTDAWWLVMEYVDGTTLSDLVREHGPLAPAEAAPLLWQVADALVAAHAAGIVHRDVKPSNVLVDRHRRVKLTDFGIARIAADPALTQSGLVTGSPAYLAPEVAAGERGDEAVDVWGLGATAFYVLAGRPPYDMGGNVLGGLYRIVNEEPPRLPDAGVLAPLLEGALVKDPTRRWSIAQARDVLAAAGQGGVARPVPVVAPPPATDSDDEAASTRVLTPTRSRGRGLVLGLLGLAVALVVGVVLLAVLPGRDATSPTAADSPPASPATSAGTRATPAPGPTARGMKSFIRGYVAAVASDPGTAWTMLSPKFQRESGGFDAYRRFWSGVGPGRVLAISADPQNMVVTYRVRFENFGTGRRPTVLDLVYDHGRYLIDGEHDDGFVPRG